MINRVLLPAGEMLQCTGMPVLERQRARTKWQEQQQQQHHAINCFSQFSGVFQQQGFREGGLSEVVTRSNLKLDPDILSRSWTDINDHVLGYGAGPYDNAAESGFELNYGAISRTSSCPPAVTEGAAAAAAAAKSADYAVSEKISSGVGRQSFKKRKFDKVQNSNTKVVEQEESRDKRIKGCAEEGDSKITERNNDNNKSSSGNNNNRNNKENSVETSKDNSKVTEVQKPDYIHVRARRGQATDSHSLAERVRREKISERMKYLQDLVPGCNKITGKAGMLDEIINYVQSLQRQVEFLSMKLAAVNPRLDFNIDSLFPKEPFPPATSANFQTIGMSSSDMTNPASYLQFNPVQQQIVPCCVMDMGMNPPDMGLRTTTSAPVSIPERFLDSSCFTQMQNPPTWDGDLQNLYNVAFDQGRPTTSFPTQPFTGSIEASNLKMEI